MINQITLENMSTSDHIKCLCPERGDWSNILAGNLRQMIFMYFMEATAYRMTIKSFGEAVQATFAAKTGDLHQELAKRYLNLLKTDSSVANLRNLMKRA